ncbi:NAD(P)-binding protein [Candidatus Aminicenantes bacterium AH-873-B07]|nr:NAD(P)-binding protein [Candidatus Aminicenantes bacterium AH-873-B07]
MPISLSDTLYNKTGSWRTFRPVHRNKLPPCNKACPTGENIQEYIYLVLEKKYEEAYKEIKKDNPIPSITGRVCPHPCEVECNRGKFDEPIAIHHIERFLGDFGLELKDEWNIKEKRERIAIIGSGPAGLACAYHLRKKGYKVKIFEAENQIGGMLRIGIPDYRLPKNILDKEIRKLEEMGIEMENGVRINYPPDLLKEYDSIFVATGAHISRKMGVTGEDLNGVISGLEFLKNLNLGGKVKIGKKVAVIGGGNTAIDAARCAMRLGAEVKILYRRSRNEMPAIESEVEEAEKEGIKIEFLTAPVRIIGENHRVSRLECIRMELGEPDESGRRRPIPIKGSEFILNFDTIISAIGEKVDLHPFKNIETTSWGVKIDEFGRTSQEKIFAGGDCVTGPSTVVKALEAGKRAAITIDCFLRGKPLPDFKKEESVSFENINLDYFEKERRIEPLKIDLQRRKKTFEEVWNSYKVETLVKEAKRCFSCGVCNKCDNCWVFCPDISIIRNKEYSVNYDYCKGCGICARECPRYVITMEEER